MNPLLITQQDKEQFIKWLEALESGNYSQTCWVLQDSDGYCCLGVGCLILIPKELQSIYGGCLAGASPYDQENCPKWLYLINQNFASRCGYSLSNVNDEQGKTFKEIAAILREVYKDEML